MLVQAHLLRVTPHMAYMDAVKSSGQLHMICRGVCRTASMYRANVESLRRLVAPMMNLVVGDCTVNLVVSPSKVSVTRVLRSQRGLKYAVSQTEEITSPYAGNRSQSLARAWYTFQRLLRPSLRLSLMIDRTDAA
jgi:hypothetical protein